jgi:hypothetical protein
MKPGSAISTARICMNNQIRGKAGSPIAQTRQTPLWEGDANYRDLEVAAFRHRIECRKDHHVGEIAGHTEEH